MSKRPHLSGAMELFRLCDLHLRATGVTAKGAVTLIRHQRITWARLCVILLLSLGFCSIMIQRSNLLALVMPGALIEHLLCASCRRDSGNSRVTDIQVSISQNSVLDGQRALFQGVKSPLCLLNYFGASLLQSGEPVWRHEVALRIIRRTMLCEALSGPPELWHSSYGDSRASTPQTSTKCLSYHRDTL